MEHRTFIGRKAQLQRLGDSLNKAAAGQLQVMFIAGEAGAGKSALAEEFVRERQAADPKLIAAIGQCNAQTGAGDPYLPFRQVLTSLTADPDEARSAAAADSEKRSTQLREFVRISSQTLIQLGPDLIGIFVPGGSLLARLPTLLATNSKLADKLAERVAPKKGKQAPPVNPALDQEKIFEQYAAVLRALAKDRTLILLLDDLQWADRGSLNLLFHLARALADSRILLLGTYRPDDVALGRDGERHPFESILNELKRYHGDIVLDLGRTGAEEGRAFTDALIDSEANHLDAAFREKLFAVTDGHPLFAVELLRNLQERGDLVKDADGRWVQAARVDWGALPARVEGVIGERIARLPQPLHETLTTASVMGYEFAAQVVARVQSLQERALVRDLSRELEKRYQLVLELGESRIGAQLLSSYRFAHALIQQYLYDELGAGERRLLHGDIAEALESIAGDAAGELALQLAHQYDLAGRPEQAIPYWRQAGDAAFAAYAQSEAIAAYTRALELSRATPVEAEQLHHLYARRGRALELDSRFEQASQNYDEMLAAARECHDRKMELDAMVAASTLYSTPTSVADPAKGRALSEQTLHLAEELGDRAVECRVLWNLLLVNLLESKPEAAIEYGERSLELARALDLPEQTAYTLSDLGWAYNIAGRLDEAEARLKDAAQLWRAQGNMPMLTNNLNVWLLNLVWRGRYEQALGITPESLEIGRTTHNLWGQLWPHQLQGQMWLEYGEVDRAWQELETSTRLAKESNTPVYVAWFDAARAAAYVSMGAMQTGMQLYRAGRVPNAQVPASPGQTATLVGYALCEIAAGQLETAASTLEACVLTNFVWAQALGLAQCRLALARQEAAQATAIAERVIEDSRRAGLDPSLAEGLLLKGRAHAMRGEREAAREAFDAARSVAQAIGSRRLLWQALAGLAETEPDRDKAAAWKAQGREVVEFIAAHMPGDDFRAEFLELAEARALLG